MRDVLDAPDQVLVGWIVFVYHRRTVDRGIVDKQVDLVTGEPRMVGTRTVTALVGQEQVAVLDHVGRDRLQIALYVWQSGVTDLKFMDQLPGRQLCHLGIQFAQALVKFALP